MANYRKKILKISKGQIADGLIERTDIGLLDSSGQVVNNFINSIFGSLVTVPGSTVTHIFGANKTVKLFRIDLKDGTDCIFAINITDKKMRVFSHLGVPMNTEYSIPSSIVFTTSDADKIRVAQNNDLILIASPSNPLLRVTISDVGAITDLSVYDIDTANILKVSNFVETAINPIVIRITPNTYPDTPENYNIGIGDICVVNQSGNPSTTFPWAGKRFNGYVTQPDPDDPDQTITVADWTDVSYTPAVGDYCYDEFDNTYWFYNGTTWTQYTAVTVNDIHYGSSYKVNATSGVIDATGFTITVTKPSGYTGTPQEYAEKLVIGCDFDGEDGLGIFRITKITGSTSGSDFNITKISGTTYITFAKADTTYSGFTIKYSQRPAFDSSRPGTVDNLYNTQNYPLNIFFYQQRLFIAGTANNPTQILASNLGKYNDFSDDYTGASTNSFQLVIAGTEKEIIQNVLLNQGLQIFTNQSEWVMSDPNITKTSGFVRNSQIGSTYTTPIIAANGITIFCPKQGVGIVGFIYNQTNASFNTPHISMLTSVFTSQTANMVLRKGYTVKDDVLIYMALTDGRLVIANYLADQEIQAFVTRSSESTSFKQCMQIENNMVYLVERNGYTVLELEDDTKNTAVSYDSFTYNSATGVISNLPALYNGLNVNVYDGNGVFIANKTVASNQVQLDAVDNAYPASVSELGINIHSEFVSNPQNINSETFSLYKTIRTVKLALKEENNAEFLRVNGKKGRNKDNFITYIRPVKPLRRCQFNITNDVYKLNILSIEIELEA